MSSPFLRERDFLNAQFGHRLSVSVASSHALLWFIAKRYDFRTLALPHDARGDLGGGEKRRADEKIGACVGEKHAIENNFVIRVAFDAVEAYNIAFFNLELPTVGFDDGEHG